MPTLRSTRGAVVPGARASVPTPQRQPCRRLLPTPVLVWHAHPAVLAPVLAPVPHPGARDAVVPGRAGRARACALPRRSPRGAADVPGGAATHTPLLCCPLVVCSTQPHPLYLELLRTGMTGQPLPPVAFSTLDCQHPEHWPHGSHSFEWCRCKGVVDKEDAAAAALQQPWHNCARHLDPEALYFSYKGEIGKQTLSDKKEAQARADAHNRQMRARVDTKWEAKAKSTVKSTPGAVAEVGVSTPPPAAVAAVDAHDDLSRGQLRELAGKGKLKQHGVNGNSSLDEIRGALRKRDLCCVTCYEDGNALPHVTMQEVRELARLA